MAVQTLYSSGFSLACDSDRASKTLGTRLHLNDEKQRFVWRVIEELERRIN